MVAYSGKYNGLLAKYLRHDEIDEPIKHVIVYKNTVDQFVKTDTLSAYADPIQIEQYIAADRDSEFRFRILARDLGFGPSYFREFFPVHLNSQDFHS